MEESLFVAYYGVSGEVKTFTKEENAIDWLQRMIGRTDDKAESNYKTFDSYIAKITHRVKSQYARDTPVIHKL